MTSPNTLCWNPTYQKFVPALEPVTPRPSLITPRLEDIWDNNILLSQQILETNKQLAVQRNRIDELQYETNQEDIWTHMHKLSQQVLDNQKNILKLQDDVEFLRKRSETAFTWLEAMDNNAHRVATLSKIYQ